MKHAKWLADCKKDRYVSDKAIAECEKVSLYPAPHPLGDSHHCDEDFSAQDKEIGDALAYFLGTLFSDVSERWFYSERTSVNEWSRVARALRIHGLKISNLG